MAGRSNRLLFLGTGTSTGVPVLGCQCRTCTSPNPKDRRTRVSALLQTRTFEEGAWESVLIDTSADLREQLMRIGAPPVSVVAYTHAHVDHFFGLDELRPLQFHHRKPIEIFATSEVQDRLKAVYDHLFNPDAQQGGGILSVNLHSAQGRFRAGPMELLPVPVWHGDLLIQGYRWGGLAFLTDCSGIPESSWPLLEDLDTLVVDALRRTPHKTHFTVDQALAVVERLSPRQAYFIHMTHDLLHEETNAELPAGVQLAYDGLEVYLPSFDPVGWEIER